ncbi:MAG: DUF2298 domain-containing protein [Dehalococcoidia bacterium]
MDALAFWAVSLAAGAVGWPICARLFRRFPDAGAGLAVPVGLLLIGFTLFTLRTASVLPAGRGGFILAAAGASVVSLVVLGRDRRAAATFRRTLPLLFILGGLFTALFFSYAAFRSYSSEILRHSEQTMDLMYLTSALRSAEYPPQDGWLSGESASYYYFGYVQMAALSSIAGVPATTGYTLALAATFASAGLAAVSVGMALTRRLLPRPKRSWAVGGGLAAAGLLLLAGSLTAPFEWAAAHGQTNGTVFRAVDLESLLPCDATTPSSADCYRGPEPRTSAWYPTEFYFWWRASRLIPDTITEFPAFSFLLGDLHPHLMSLPLVITAVALAVAEWQRRDRSGLRRIRRQPFEALFLGVVLGALAFGNAWDAPTFVLLFAAALFAREARTLGLVAGAKASAGFLAPVVALAVVLYLPWYAGFSSQANGFHAYARAGSVPSHVFLQWGPLLLALLAATAFFVRRSGTRSLGTPLTYAAWLPLAPLLVWIALLSATGDLSTAVEARGAGGWVTLIGYAALLCASGAATLKAASARHPAALPLGLGVLGALLLYGAELFYIGDVFEGSVPRLNTVFKLSYQAWAVLALAGGALIVAGLFSSARARLAAAAVATVAVISLTFAVIAIPNRSSGFDGPAAVDGLDFVRRSDPAEYELTRWVEANTKRGTVIVEASGRRWANGPDGPSVVDANVDYTDAGRIAARAGTRAPVGQYFHEIQWRGDSEANHQLLTKRQELVDAIYLSGDPAVTLANLREVGAELVVVGRLELQRYAAAGLADLASFLDPVFASGDLRVYAVPVFHTVRTS